MSRTAVIVSDAEDGRALCRLCMIYHEYFVNIFIPNTTFRICAEEAIHDLLSLKVAVGDGLPSNICHQCVNKLIEFRDFKQMCFKTAAELRMYDLDNILRVSKIKDEGAADKETSREGISQENAFPTDIHVTEVYITMPDKLAIETVSYAKEELWSSENVLVVKDEVNDGGHRIECDVPMNALTSVAVDPLAFDTVVLKEEAQEPKGAAGDRNNLSDTSPHNHIQVTEVFAPVPDQLSMWMVRHIEEDTRPTELMVKEEIGEGPDCSENDIPVVSLSSVNVDPLAVDTTIDIKVDDEIRMGDCSLNIEVRREDGLLENKGSGKECSGGGAPTSATKPENQVDCCNYVGEISLESEFFLDKFVSNRQVHLQHQLPSNSSYDHVHEENLQYEYSTANKLLAHCHSGTGVQTKENKKPSNPNNISSLSNDFKQLKCDDCGKKFRYRCDLKRHLVIHTGVKPFKCNVCGKNFAQKSDLKRHIVIHTGMKQYKCDVCGKMFTQKGNLKSHYTLHTGGKAFACNVCGKNFTQKSSLKRHLVIHTGMKQYKCDVCGKMFTQKGYLKSHYTLHTGGKAFACNVCGKNFTQKSSLKRHIVIHTGMKPYKCDVCGKMFTQKGYLKSHYTLHTVGKAFSCNVCGKNFTQKSDLNRHLVIHTGEKPFKCNLCGKSFTQKGYLKKHLVIHTGEKLYKCDLCGKEYKWRRDLRGHLLTHANLKPPK